jgi:hypothetical protein
MTNGEISANKDSGLGSECSTALSFTMSGGTIKNNANNGITLRDDSENCTVSISGGTISGNSGDGVAIEGKGHSATISGSITTTIIGSINLRGISVGVKSEDCVVNIDNGKITGNGIEGVLIMGTGNRVFMRDGEISNSIKGVLINDNANEHGLDPNYLPGGNNFFNMSGGVISRSVPDQDPNDGSGLFLTGVNNGFEKGMGAVIYGNAAGNNSNQGGAIRVSCDNSGHYKFLPIDAASNEVYAATINADNSAFTNLQGSSWQ